jgi:hypothetical protein
MLETGNSSVQVSPGPAGDDHLRPGPDEPGGRGAPDAARPAGDDDDFPVQLRRV